jgi:ribosomal protein S18 acetylase RimI-like enzyme
MFTIRRADTTDIPLIRELCFQVWPQTYASMLTQAQIDFMLEWMYSEASLQQQLQEGVVYLLCYQGSRPVGFAAYVDRGNGLCKLEKLYVLQDQQGQGTGRFLVHHISNAASARGNSVLQLQVNKNNVAQRFYQKLGFVIAREAVFDIGNGFVMDDYVMELKLQKSLR